MLPTPGVIVGHLDETRLPGIGTRVEFVTDEGRRMGVVQHHGGRREVFVCPLDDPDSTQVSVRLSQDDAHSLAEALGVISIGEERHERTYEVEGLVFEWLDVDEGSPAAGTTIAQQQVRSRTGASIVAVIRPSGSVPAPEPSFGIEAGDTLVVAGTADGVESLRSMLRTR